LAGHWRVATLHLDDSRVQIEAPATKKLTFNSYNHILDHIGQLGTYQKRNFLLLCLPVIFTAPLIMSYTFTAAVPQYRCLVANCEDANDTDTPVTEPCQAWIYDKSQIQSSIVTDFDLTCDDEWKHTLTNTLFMTAVMIGGVLTGNIADLIGRKKSLTGITLALASLTTGSVFVTDYTTFTVLRFLTGLLTPGFFAVIFVWGVEAVGQKHRVMCGFIYHLLVSVSSCGLAVIAYYVRDWRRLQLFVSAPMFLLLPLYWFIPESTRWLISKHRYEEAKQLILKAAETNHKLIPIHFTIEQHKKDEIRSAGLMQKSSENFFGLLRSPVLCKRLVTISLAWIATNLGFYGLTFSAANLSIDIHLNFLLSMVVEVPSYVVGIIVMNSVGRRFTLSGGLLISGLACLITGLVPAEADVVRMIFSLLGKFFLSCVMATVFNYSSELFPDVTRSTVIGLCSTVGRAGAIIAPVLEDTGRNVDATLPYIIFAGVSIVVGLVSLILPETLQSPLPATIQEAEDIEK